MTDREAFEKWAMENGYSTKTYALDPEHYFEHLTTRVMQAWEAGMQARVPEGYVVVPREPTPEIIQAMNDRMYEGADYIDANSIEFNLLSEVYRAAIAASAGE